MANYSVLLCRFSHTYFRLDEITETDMFKEIETNTAHIYYYSCLHTPE